MRNLKAERVAFIVIAAFLRHRVAHE